MRILQLVHVPRNPNGGSAGVTLRLAAEWRAAGHQVEDVYASELGAAVGNVGTRSRRARDELLAVGAAVIGLARQRRVDVIYATGHLGWILYPLVRLRSRRPLLIAASFGLEHEEKHASELLDETDRSRLRHWLSGRTRLPEVAGTIRHADGFVALTQFTATRVLAAGWKKESELLVSGCGVPDECHEVQRSPRSEWTGTIVWCGTTIGRKGWEYFVSALAQCERGLLRRVHVLGSGRQPHDVRRELAGAGVSSIEISVHSELSRIDQCHILAASDVFVSTSIYEGFHRALLEAMAIGLPCVATETGFVKDQPRPGDICELVPMHDAAAVAKAVRRLASDDSRRCALSEDAKVLSESFAWSSLAEEQLAWMEALTSRLTPR